MQQDREEGKEGGYGAKYQQTILQSKQDGARHGLSSSECNKLFLLVQHFVFLPFWAGVTLTVSLTVKHIAPDSTPMSLPPFSTLTPPHRVVPPGSCSTKLRTDKRNAISRAKESRIRTYSSVVDRMYVIARGGLFNWNSLKCRVHVTTFIYY